MIVVRKHKGHSGMSVFDWRVYNERLHNRVFTRTQLGKYRTQEEAEQAANHYRENEKRVAAIRAAFDERVAAARAERTTAEAPISEIMDRANRV